MVTKPIKPVLHDILVEMGAYWVCCDGYVMYDPLVGIPVYMSDFDDRTFDEYISVRFNTEKERSAIDEIFRFVDYSSMCQYFGLTFNCG